MIKYVIAIAVVGALLFAVDRNGYRRCQARQQAAVAEKKLEDAKAVTGIKEKAIERKTETAKTIVVVRKVVDPSGCARAVYPDERAGRLREFYRQ